MADRKPKKLFERALTYEELTDMLEMLIRQMASHEQNVKIMLEGAKTMVDAHLAQQEELTVLQAQLELRDIEFEILTKRIMILEQANGTECGKDCSKDSPAKR